MGEDVGGVLETWLRGRPHPRSLGFFLEFLEALSEGLRTSGRAQRNLSLARAAAWERRGCRATFRPSRPC